MGEKATLVSLTENRFKEAVQCFVNAFSDEPGFEFLFPELDSRQKRMEAIFEFSCKYRLLVDEPMFGLDLNGELVAVTHLSSSKKPESTKDVEDLWATYATVMGEETDERFDEYTKIKKALMPDEPHTYVVSLVVKPGKQGKGYGGQLLEEICSLSKSDPNSKSTMLDTTKEINVRFYEKHGFEVIGESELGACPIFLMRRPN